MSDTPRADEAARAGAYLTNGEYPETCGKQIVHLDIARQLERERNAWEETAAQHLRNEQYYRGLVENIAEHYGEQARTADDGTVYPDGVLCIKVPELVEQERRLKDTALRIAAGIISTFPAFSHRHPQDSLDFIMEQAALELKKED